VSTNDRSPFLERKKHHRYSGVNKAKRYHEKKNARIRDHLDDIGASPGTTGSIGQLILFAAAQNRAMQERWEAVQASKTPRRLRMVIGMTKGKAVDSYFQAIRNKVGRDECGDAVLQREFLAVVKG
jgi:folylpolyglutamate synthase/dihydropteroate synthase